MVDPLFDCKRLSMIGIILSNVVRAGNVSTLIPITVHLRHTHPSSKSSHSYHTDHSLIAAPKCVTFAKGCVRVYVCVCTLFVFVYCYQFAHMISD